MVSKIAWFFFVSFFLLGLINLISWLLVHNVDFLFFAGISFSLSFVLGLRPTNRVRFLYYSDEGVYAIPDYGTLITVLTVLAILGAFISFTYLMLVSCTNASCFGFF